MGTEVKLKREAIERRIAELEGKMPDIQASKEGAEARATIRRNIWSFGIRLSLSDCKTCIMGWNSIAGST